MLGIAHKLKAPIIGTSSCNIMPWHFPRIGLPYEPGFYPTTFIGASDNMSFSSRISNWFTFVYMNTLYRFLTEPDTNKLLSRRFGDDIPDLSVLTKKVSLMFVNQHYALSGAKHLSPNVIELGGIHIEKANELDPVGMHNIICTRLCALSNKLFRNCKIFLIPLNMGWFISALDQWYAQKPCRKKSASRLSTHLEN